MPLFDKNICRMSNSPRRSRISNLNQEPISLVEVLRRKAHLQPELRAYTFLHDGDSNESSVSYGELDAGARAIASSLQMHGAAGARVLLLYPAGLDYVAAFFGALYAGAIAVPLYPPRPNHTLQKLHLVAADSQATIACTVSSVMARIEPLLEQFPELKKLRWVVTDRLDVGSEVEWREPVVSDETIAFIQYTSGSTSQPKGVMVSHGNLLHNERMIQSAFHQSERSVVVGWLPLYHDMGLIGNVLQPMYVGAHCVLMSPVSFLQSPYRWLQAISRYKATTSGGPNFAYELCIRKVTAEQRAALDLSSWCVAFNGAEPVREETINLFAETFESCGFRREAFYPCYGLAEATLFVSGGEKGRGTTVKSFSREALERNIAVEAEEEDENTSRLVGCGRAWSGQQVRVVDPYDAKECAPGSVGEIWVAGPSVAKGYWNKPDETEKVFNAHMSDWGEGPFLRTGDLGFMHGGELFVTGRLKDLIIIRGVNHYPHDIELSVERSHPALRPGCGAAFSVSVKGEERLAIVQEVNRRPGADFDEIIDRIRHRVVENHEVQVAFVTLIKPHTILKTSSGKIRRSACREAFLQGHLLSVAVWKESARSESVRGVALPSETQALDAVSLQTWLIEHLSAKLHLDSREVDVRRSITSYGADSLAAVELIHSIETGLGVSLPPAELLRSSSIAELAEQLHILLLDDATNRTTGASTDEPIANPTDSIGTHDADSLSVGQQALWFIHQLAPHSPAYNIANAVRVKMPLDVSALRRAFQSLIDRHSILRTTIKVVGGKPSPVEHISATICFRTENAFDLSEADFNDRLAEESHAPFDLEHGPLLRVKVFERGSLDHVILLVVHHIITDFWSLSVMMDELAQMYDAEAEGSILTLPPLRLRYADYVSQQTERLSGARGAALRSYWERQLAGELPSLDFPSDHKRPSIQSFRGESFSFRISKETSLRLKELGQSRGATLYTTLLAAFNLLLHRYTGQTDILVGTPTSGRERADLASLVGYFVNPVVIRTRIEDNPTFEEFLTRVRGTALEAFEHQEYPFPLLVEHLQPERDLSRSPLFQVMFVLQQAPPLRRTNLSSFALGERGAIARLGSLQIESVALKQRVSQFDLLLMMAETDEGLAASLQYSTDIFERKTIERLSTHFTTLLDGIVAEPYKRISDLPLLTEEERHRLLLSREENREKGFGETLLHEQFERQVSKTPDRTAVIDELTHLTYAELNQRADKLAHRLREYGVGPESLVGVMTKRSASMIVALLGILKAGGAYVPLDPAYPKERLQFIMEDTNAPVLVSERETVELLPETRAHIVLLDAKEDSIESESDENIRPCISSGNLAYIIYTSGSTGKPKGVAIEHRSASTLLDWSRIVFTPEQLRGTLVATSICFDLSVFEIFVPLSCGGCLIIAENALQLTDLNAAGQVTLINTVPSAMTELLRSKLIPASVRTVNLAGEPLTSHLVQSLYEQSDIQSVYNLYGPSEDTTYSTYVRIEKGATTEPTIGRPISNTETYVLDQYRQPVPTGVVGELYIGGDGVARGYLNRPELTAERFVPHPFSMTPGARLYRTGDLVRYRADGNLEYLGRRDHQVKLRGFRIELGEIEAMLRSHPSVADALVTLHDTEGEKRIVAYIVTSQSSSLGADHLRGHLKERLPNYMIPSAFVELERMPLLPNGKIDRHALPPPGTVSRQNQQIGVYGRTPVEEILLGICADLLRVKRISLTDNFFEVGGHSLLATQLLSRIKESFNVDLPLRHVFEHPTMGQLAALIESRMGACLGESQQPLLPVRRDGPLPLSYAQQRLWLTQQLEPASAAYNIASAVRLEGRLNRHAFEQLLNEIVRRHEATRTRFIRQDESAYQHITENLQLQVPQVDLSGLNAEARVSITNKLIIAEAKTPFDLERDLLLRMKLLRLSERENVVLLTMHHIISDGWSINILIEEMSSLYEAFTRGEPSTLEELPVQYADYAIWQRRMLQGELLESHLSYWRRQLHDSPQVLKLPTDRPRPAVRSGHGRQEAFTLPPKLSAALEALSASEGTTLFMTLLAAFDVLLYRYGGQKDIVLGTNVANRRSTQTEKLIGFFVNMLVLRTDLSGNPTFRELLERVREVTLDAYTHQDLPFEKLVQVLRPERSLSHSLLFQAVFSLQNAGQETLKFSGLSLSPIEIDLGTAKYDLVLNMWKGGEGLQGILQYSTDLFEPSTIARMLKHFQRLLESIVTAPQTRINALGMLTPEENSLLEREIRITELDAGFAL